MRRPNAKKGDQQHQRRVGVEDQPLESGGDVLQAEKIEIARAVVAEHADRPDHQPVAPRYCGMRVAARFAQPHQGEDRQRESHAQREQRHRIDTVGIGELDQDGLEREAHRGNHRQQRADSRMRAAGLGESRSSAADEFCGGHGDITPLRATSCNCYDRRPAVRRKRIPMTHDLDRSVPVRCAGECARPGAACITLARAGAATVSDPIRRPRRRRGLAVEAALLPALLVLPRRLDGGLPDAGGGDRLADLRADRQRARSRPGRTGAVRAAGGLHACGPAQWPIGTTGGASRCCACSRNWPPAPR